MQEVSKDCSVVLEDIKGVSDAVYQGYRHPDSSEETESLQEAREAVRSYEKGVTAVLNEEGKVVSEVPINEGTPQMEEKGHEEQEEQEEDEEEQEEETVAENETEEHESANHLHCTQCEDDIFDDNCF